MTREKLAADLRAVAELRRKATAGPWSVVDPHPLHVGPYVGAPGRHTSDGMYVAVTASDSDGLGQVDAAFIAAAANLDWDALLAALEGHHP